MAGQRFSSGQVSQWGRNSELPGSGSLPVLAAGAYLDGVNGLVNGGVTGNFANVPDSAAISVTGDIDIKIKATLPSWAAGVFFRKWVASSQQSFYLRNLSGALQFVWSSTGSNTLAESSPAHSIANGATKWVRITMDVDNGSSQRVTKFYLSDNGTTWTQLGSTSTTAGATSFFDSTSALGIAADIAGANQINGTIHRLIIQSAFDTVDNTTSVVFDADFAAQTADALAFTESSTNAASVTIQTTRYSYGLPNVQWSTSNATEVVIANRIFYQPFLVTAPIYVDGTQFHVTSGPASSANVRTGIYAADANLQPVGGPVLDAGNTTVGTSATGTFFTQVVPVLLQPGVYLTAINSSVGLTYRVVRGGIVGADVANGTSSIFSIMFAGQTQGAFPNPGTSWDTRVFAATGPNHYLFLRWRPAL